MAGNRPADWHVLDLDKDPTPGDPDRVRNLAKNLHDFADDVSKVLRDIKGMAGEDAILTWAGKTAESFTAEFEDAPGKLKKLKKSYEMAGDALSTYWPELERAQALADKALVKGREAQGDLSSAQTRLTSADSWMDKAGKEADKYKDDDGGSKAGKDVPKPDPDKVKAATRNANSAEKAHTAAKSDVSAAKSNLDAAKKMAEDARKMREDAAGTAKKKLEDASDAGIQNRKWWEEVGDWVTDNWDTIVAVCKVVVAVLGVIAMIIGGPILGAIVLIAALVVLADTLHKYANGEAGLLDVAFAALDCIPGMKGLTSLRGLAKGMKGLKAGLKGMTAGVKGLGKRLPGMGRKSVKESPTGSSRPKDSVCSNGSDPIDLATGRMYLPQTDITLPGTLPLSFTRRVESSYRAGWWFGPSWSSTADQRLEFDEEGVIFIHEEGLLLAYPSPQADTAVLPSHGPRWPLTQTGDGLYAITDPATGHVRQFKHRDTDLALIDKIEDRNGNKITFDYDDHGAPTSIQHSGGYHLKITTDEERITALHLAGAAADGGDQEILSYGYLHGHLTSVTNSSALPLRFAYDPAGRVTSWTDTNARSYSYEYDDKDRCIAEGGPEGHMSLRLTYDEVDEATGHKVTTATTGQGHTRRYLINDANHVVAEFDPLGAVTRFERDPYNQLLLHQNPLGQTTRFRYDEAGNLAVVIRPDGSEAAAEYNGLGLPIRVVNADGTVWHQSYDGRGNRTSVTDPAGATTYFDYDAAGGLTSVTDASGHCTQFQTNAVGLPVNRTDALGAISRYGRDRFGRITAVTDPLGNTTRLEWTIEGKLTQRIAADGNTELWAYDGEGNCTSHTDRMGGVSLFEYTHFDLLTARTGPDGVRHEFTHDTELRLTQVCNPQGLTWSYSYDPAGRLISEKDFDGRTLDYTYDAADRLISRVNAMAQTISYEHDELGQVITKRTEDGSTTYRYDAMGRLVWATGRDATLVRCRDSLGLLKTETVNGRTTTYTHNSLGQRTSRVTPAGAISNWSYDAAGRRSQLAASGRTIDFTSDSTGREVARHIGEGITLAHAFDDIGQLTDQSVTTADGRSIQHRAYNYRADGHLVRVDDQLNGARSFELDAAGRVTAVRASNWTETYAYDEAGNQSHADWPDTHPGYEATGQRTYCGTRITSAGKVRYEHDSLGRITLRQKIRLSRKPDTWRYCWDAEDRLVAVTTPDGTVWRYLYDPLGRRIAKQRLASGGKTVVERTEFTWDATTLCEQTTTAAESPDPITLTWDHKGFRPVAQTERISTVDTPQAEIDTRFFAIVTDLVGTPSELISEDGHVAWRTRATHWGTTTWNRDASAYTPLRFPGQYFDPETGLHYNFFRHYDPETARYLTPDPLGLSPAPNPVTYIDNPHTQTDFLGLSPDDYEHAPDYSKDWTSKASLERHYGDHGSDLGHYTQDDYAEGAHDLMVGPRRPGVREKDALIEGKVTRWDPETNEYGVKDRSTGKIITYFDSSIDRAGNSSDAWAKKYWDNNTQGMEQ